MQEGAGGEDAHCPPKKVLGGAPAHVGGVSRGDGLGETLGDDVGAGEGGEELEKKTDLQNLNLLYKCKQGGEI